MPRRPRQEPTLTALQRPAGHVKTRPSDEETQRPAQGRPEEAADAGEDPSPQVGAHPLPRRTTDAPAENAPGEGAGVAILARDARGPARTPVPGVALLRRGRPGAAGARLAHHLHPGLRAG